MKLSIPILVLVILFISGCTFFKPKLDSTVFEINERTRENNSAAKIANQRTAQHIIAAETALDSTNFFNTKLSLDLASEANDISGLFLRRNENLMGLPIEDQTRTINRLTSTNSSIKSAEIRNQETKEKQEENLRRKVEDLEKKLLEYGAKFEEERNKNIVKRIWAWSIGVFGIGGTIALLIFFPFLIPIFTQIIAQIVSWIPSLAHFFGVVSKKSVNSIVEGVGAVRNQLKTENRLESNKKYSASEILKLLDTELKIATDKSDKRIIESLRAKLSL